MLLNNFFYIEDLSQVDNKIIAKIRVNADHEILEGHFPKHPIVPGVCIIEILKEILQSSFSKKWMLTESSMVKFLHLFSLPTYTSAYFEIETSSVLNDKINVSAVLKYQNLVFFKFKGIFSEIK